MRYVRKRDGRLAKFDSERITNAIWKAAKAVGGKDKDLAKRLSKQVVDELEKRFGEEGVPTVEEIQDLVEKILIENGHARTAKAYILYRKQHQDMREMAYLLSSADLADKYLEVEDWRIRENANMSYSLQGLNNYLSSTVIAKYWLTRIYPPNIGEAHASGDLHIHNLGVLGPYCVGWDLRDLLLSGFGGVPGKIESKPAKHFRTALGQIVNFFYTLQGEAAGAQAFSNFDTYLAPFIRYDGLNEREVKQALQEFLFNINIPTRVGFQTPFTNVTIDLNIPDFMKDEAVIVGGGLLGDSYGSFQTEMDVFNTAFAEVMSEGDAKGRVFTFPIPTYNITSDFDWESPVAQKLFDMTAKYGVPYFSNFINSDMKPEDVRSMCCRLRIDNRELRKRGGGFFGANPLTGCYDKDTEVLTENGWKSFEELSRNERVFTRTEDGFIELHKPTRIFKYDWDGNLIRFKHRSFDLLVTPNHRLLVEYQVRGKWKSKFVEARDFDVNNHRIPKQSKWKGRELREFLLPPLKHSWRAGNHNSLLTKQWKAERIDMDTWLKFFSLYLADGSVDNEEIAPSHGYRVFLSQIKEKHKHEIRKVLERLPFDYREEETGFIIYNKQLWSYLKQFGSRYTKWVPRWIKELPPEKLRIFFEWLVKGDGHRKGNPGQITYWTTSKRLATDVQEIVLKIGWISTIAKRKTKGILDGRTIESDRCYTIGVQQSRRYRLRKNNITSEYYKGKVCCCEVPNHTIMVRRNGKSTWCGNSIGVVTINLPRIGYLEKDEDRFFERLGELMDIASDSLEIKRKALERFTEKGLYPYCRHYLRLIGNAYGRYWKNHFSTIGLVGMNEALLNLFGYDITSREGLDFSVKILNFMRDRLSDYQEETGNIYNLEATPAESTSYRFARIDKKKYSDIIVANENYLSKGAEPFYTNSSQLPVDYAGDLFEALEHQDRLQTLYTGGTVFHIFLGERVSSWRATANLVKRVAENSHLPYFTLTPTFSVCPTHGYLEGERRECPICGVNCEIYSRVVGYLRPVDQWNDGKQAEFNIRKTFDQSVLLAASIR